MTRDQIIAKWNGLTPRERDAWLAEVVFGYETYGAFYEPNGVRVLIPRYTEDIVAAWTVFEAIKMSGAWVEVAYNPVHQRYRGFIGANKVPGISGADIGAPTAPEAISLAAIIAKLSPAE